MKPTCKKWGMKFTCSYRRHWNIPVRNGLWRLTVPSSHQAIIDGTKVETVRTFDFLDNEVPVSLQDVQIRIALRSSKLISLGWPQHLPVAPWILDVNGVLAIFHKMLWKKLNRISLCKYKNERSWNALSYHRWTIVRMVSSWNRRQQRLFGLGKTI